MMMNNNILITCIAAPLFIVIRENPPKPPSKVATEKPKEKDFFKAVIMALKDKNFLILLLVFIFVNGAFVAIGTDFAIIFADPKFKGGPYSTGAVSLLGAGSTVIGVCFAFFFGWILKITKKNLLLLRLCCFMSCFCLAVDSTFIATSGNKIWVSLFAILNGCFEIAAIPISVNFASEITFPQDPTVITGFVLMSSRIFGFVFIILTTIVANVGPAPAGFFLCALCGVSFLLSLLLKEEMKKSNFADQ